MTEHRGYRVTPQRAAELEAQIAELRGETRADLEALRRELLAQLRPVADAADALARALGAASLQALRRLPSPPSEE